MAPAAAAHDVLSSRDRQMLSRDPKERRGWHFRGHGDHEEIKE
jgi:hypothetical protein